MPPKSAPEPAFERIDLDDLSPITLREDAPETIVHVPDRESLLAIKAALAANRPLLVKGEPGLGKSQLAHAAAKLLGWTLRTHTVDASTEPRDLKYTIDAVERLAQAQLAARQNVDVSLERFIEPGALWWGFDPVSASQHMAKRKGAPKADEEAPPGTVLLIDEIDKADVSIPNAVLDALGSRYFEVPSVGRVEMKGQPPLVVITTNGERELPDAFVRRCFVLELYLRGNRDAVVKELMRRGRPHFPGANEDSVFLDAATLIATRREQAERDNVPGPGVAEYIDLVRAALALQAQPELLKEIATLVLNKHGAPPGGGRPA